MILVTGASGRIGSRVSELLSVSGQRLRLMSREPGKIKPFRGAEIVYGDFRDVPSLDAGFAGVDTALVISGKAPPGDRAEQHRNAFDAARRSGVRHVVYLSLEGASHESRYPYNRDHCVSEEYLAATKIPCTILRDSFYMEMFIDEFDASGVIRGPAGTGRGAFVARESVALTVTAVLKNPPGGVRDVTGPQALTVDEVARRFSALVGRRLSYEPESATAMTERLRAAGVPQQQIELKVGWFEAIAAGELAHPSDCVRRFTGVSALTLEENFTRFPNLLAPLRPQGE